MKKWEYDFRKINPDSVINHLHMNELGADGWELVGILSLPKANIFYFKREKVEKIDPVDVD